MRKAVSMVLGIVLAAWVSAQEMPPVTGGGEVTLKDVAGTSTLVTIITKDVGAQDKNLRILEVHDKYFTVISENNDRGAYMFDDVKEIRVQGGALEAKRFVLDDAHTLRAEEQKVVERAFARAREIFTNANDNQSVKMRAAMLLAVNRDEEALTYLNELAKSNDLLTSLQALRNLYLAGETNVNKEILKHGLESGNRNAKSLATLLSGLFNDDSNEPFLNRLLQDRSADLAAPAAKSLARLGNRDCIPTLLRMISENSKEKGDAAVFALSLLGGPDVASDMKEKYKSAIGETRFRIAAVLYNIKDPMGRELLQNEFMQVPTLAPSAARILAREGDWEGMQLLRNRLNTRFDPIKGILMARADAAEALVVGGDLSYIGILQELLRADDEEVVKYACQRMVDVNKRQLIPVTQPAIESANFGIAMEACATAIAIANVNDFFNRLTQLRK